MGEEVYVGGGAVCLRGTGGGDVGVGGVGEREGGQGRVGIALPGSVGFVCIRYFFKDVGNACVYIACIASSRMEDFSLGSVLCQCCH